MIGARFNYNTICEKDDDCTEINYNKCDTTLKICFKQNKFLNTNYKEKKKKEIIFKNIYFNIIGNNDLTPDLDQELNKKLLFIIIKEFKDNKLQLIFVGRKI